MFASGANDSDDLLINCSSTKTTPAITSACALVRESASPWSTSNLSMRSRFIDDTLTQNRAYVSAALCENALRATVCASRTWFTFQTGDIVYTFEHLAPCQPLAGV